MWNSEWPGQACPLVSPCQPGCITRQGPKVTVDRSSEKGRAPNQVPRHFLREAFPAVLASLPGGLPLCPLLCVPQLKCISLSDYGPPPPHKGGKQGFPGGQCVPGIDHGTEWVLSKQPSNE